MTPRKITARHLILDLILAIDNHTLQARQAIAACKLFGISENSTRVALVRLAAEDLIRTQGRGLYQIGPAGIDLVNDVTTWRNREQHLRPWHGHYLAVFIHGLGRSDRTALRRRERALGLLGFRELSQGLFVRPDNIDDDMSTLTQRLHRLGLEPEATVLQVSSFGHPATERVLALWDVNQLNRQYRQLKQSLDDWMQTAGELELEAAARESFLIGHQAIRAVIYDPLLPDSLIDGAARQAFFATVQAYDQLGRRIWQQFFQSGS